MPDAGDVHKLAALNCLIDMLARETQAVRHFLLSQHWQASDSKTEVNAYESDSELTRPTAQSLSVLLSKKLKMLKAIKPHQPSSSTTDDNH
jgi:hypothetical protein